MHSLALGKEGRDNDCASSTQTFAAEVGLSHVHLHDDGLLVAESNGL